MRMWSIGAAATVAAVAGLVGGLSAATGEPVAEDQGSTTLRFDVRFRPFDQAYVDVGAPGPSLGDPIVFLDRLRRNGERVGLQSGTCTVTNIRADGFGIHCLGTMRLPGGQITFQGLVTNAPRKVLAVTGGTGRFRGAAGTATLVELGRDEAGTMTVRLDAAVG